MMCMRIKLYKKIFVCMCVFVSCSVVSDSLRPHGLYVACQAPLSIEFSRPEYWSELPFRFPGDLPNPGIRPRSPTLQEDSLPAEPSGKPKNPGVGCHFLLQGNLSLPWIEPGSPALQADSLLSEPPGKPTKTFNINYCSLC